MRIIRLTLTISLVIGLLPVLLGQADQDSLKSTRSIAQLIQSTDQNIENDSLTVLTGNLFSKSIKHKYIRVSNYTGTYIHVYTEKDSYKIPILVARIHPMSFVSDTIFDINGDKIPDLAIHWYPSSGCCLANIYNCFLYTEKMDFFSKKNEIPNATFYPQKKTTYSMTYGHPGETVFYELTWNNNKIDTLKSYQWNNRSQAYIVVTDFESTKKTTANHIPLCLKKLNGFEWFAEERVNK